MSHFKRLWNRVRYLVLALFSLFVVVLSQVVDAQTAYQPHNSDESAIVSIFTRDLGADPVPLYVRNVVIVQSYALLQWIQGETGGEAVFRRTDNPPQWTLIRGAGGSFGTDTLVSLGVPSDIAAQLIQQKESQDQPQPTP